MTTQDKANDHIIELGVGLPTWLMWYQDWQENIGPAFKTDHLTMSQEDHTAIAEFKETVDHYGVALLSMMHQEGKKGCAWEIHDYLSTLFDMFGRSDLYHRFYVALNRDGGYSDHYENYMELRYTVQTVMSQFPRKK